MIAFLLMVIWILVGIVYIVYKGLSGIYSVNKKMSWKENIVCFPAKILFKMIKIKA